MPSVRAVHLSAVPLVPGTTMNRLCGFGLVVVITAARAIRSGEAELIVAGCVESMSRAGHSLCWALGSQARLELKPGEKSLSTMCIGMGQGIAAALEAR